MSFTMIDDHEYKDMEKNDFELALKLDREEKEMFTRNNDNSSSESSLREIELNVDFIGIYIVPRPKN